MAMEFTYRKKYITLRDAGPPTTTYYLLLLLYCCDYCCTTAYVSLRRMISIPCKLRTKQKIPFQNKSTHNWLTASRSGPGWYSSTALSQHGMRSLTELTTCCYLYLGPGVVQSIVGMSRTTTPDMHGRSLRDI